MKKWNTPWGALNLSRQPYDTDPEQRPWTDADLALARYALETLPPSEQLHVVYNDAFGALSALLVKNGRTVAQISDSSLSQRSTLWNLEANRLEADELFLLDSLTIPHGKPQSEFSPVVLYLIPRALTLLEFQLQQIRSILSPGTVLALAALNQRLTPEVRPLIERIIGPTQVQASGPSAQLILANIESKPLAPSPFPVVGQLPGLNLRLVSHAALASPGTLAPGMALLLRHFPRLNPNLQTIIDLGCGSGLLGLLAAQRLPDAEIYCVDESFMAVWSARESFRLNQLGGRGFFLAGDCLEDFGKLSADLIFCHPPLDFQQAPTTAVAERMFSEAHQVLRSAGELWVIAHQSLQAHQLLRHLFAEVKTVAQSPDWLVFRARKGSSA